jgi:hypothetical protein
MLWTAMLPVTYCGLRVNDGGRPGLWVLTNPIAPCGEVSSTRVPGLPYRGNCAETGLWLRQTQQSFRLQKELIFETMPLTAEAPASRPWWLAYPDYPCTTLVTLARSATRQLGSGQKEQAGEEALYWESSVFGDG